MIQSAPKKIPLPKKINSPKVSFAQFSPRSKRIPYKIARFSCINRFNWISVYYIS